MKWFCEIETVLCVSSPDRASFVVGFEIGSTSGKMVAFIFFQLGVVPEQLVQTWKVAFVVF